MSFPPAFQTLALRLLPHMPAGLARALAGRAIIADGARLDPIVQIIIRNAPVRNTTKSDPETLAQERANSDATAPLLSPRPKGRVDTTDLQLPGAAGPRKARLYRPAGLPDAAPVLIYFHGGGHVHGSITLHDLLCRALADAAGIAVIAYDYRLAPEHPFPAGIEDCIAGFRGLASIAPDLGLDPTRIAVGGDSAGANCAAVVAQACRDDSPAPALQFLYVPWVDMAEQAPSYRTFAKGFMLEAARMKWFTRLYLNGADATDPRASPLRGDLTGLCPALIWTAGFDPLRDEGEAYAAALKRAGITVQLERLADLPHLFPVLANAVPSAQAAVTRSAALLGRMLREMRPL